jgi:hypothetical protein
MGCSIKERVPVELRFFCAQRRKQASVTVCNNTGNYTDNLIASLQFAKITVRIHSKKIQILHLIF